MDLYSTDLRQAMHDIGGGDGWVRALLERTDGGTWTLRYAQLTVGESPSTWPEPELWTYEDVVFTATRVRVAQIVEALRDGAELYVSPYRVSVAGVGDNVQVQHHPSFELHDRDRSPVPSFDYSFSRRTQRPTTMSGHGHYLVSSDGPSFTDLDAAYRAFFERQWDVPANGSVPEELARIRVCDRRGWLGPIHVTPTELTVEIEGHDVKRATLEFFSPTHRARLAIDGPGVMRVPLHEGLPTSNTWLWLTEGTSWWDFRALSQPWASPEQLEDAGVQVEGIGVDKQALIEALIFGGEGPTVEFKSQLPERSSTSANPYKTMAAFASGVGGTIVFGVDRDEQTVIGIGEEDLRAARDRLGQLIHSHLSPVPPFTADCYSVDGKSVLVLSIEPGDSPPYGVITHPGARDRPHFYVRRGASTYFAQSNDIAEAVRRVASVQGSLRDVWPRY